MLLEDIEKSIGYFFMTEHCAFLFVETVKCLMCNRKLQRNEKVLKKVKRMGKLLQY